LFVREFLTAFETSDWIALVSAAIAIFALWHSEKAAKEARRANEIALHNERLQIYKGLLKFRGRMLAKGVQIDGSDIFEFYRTSVSLSEFYLEKSVHEQLNKLFRLVNEMKKSHNEWEAAQNGCDETRKRVV